MRCFSVISVVFFCTSLAAAQGDRERLLCNSGSAATIERNKDVVVQKVNLSGKWGSAEAMVYLPDKEIAEGAVVFSHSAIHADTGASIQLLPFAFTLAHAGTAVIVPLRTLNWQPNSRSENREGAPVICAEHWLIDHTQVVNNGEPVVNAENVVVREGYGYVGPRLCDPNVASDCDLTDPFVSEDCSLKHYCRPNVWVPVGETEGADSTNNILADGGLWVARWLQRHLRLAPIDALTFQTPAPGHN